MFCSWEIKVGFIKSQDNLIDLNSISADWFEPQTTMPTTTAPNVVQKVDYSKLLDAYLPKNWTSLPTNPYYTTADGYFELNTAPSANKDVELLKPNCRERGSYKLKTNNAHYKVSLCKE